MTPEQRFKHRIRDALIFSRWDVQAIESSTGRGIPDLSVAKQGCGDFWIEVKYGDPEPKLRPEQNAWLTRGAMHGRQCCVVWSWDKSIWKFHIQHYTSAGKTFRLYGDNLELLLSPNV